MTFEILLILLVGAAFLGILTTGRATAPNPARWLSEAARSGVTIKVTATENSGEWVLSFSFNENLDELRKQALDMRDAGRKIEAIKLVRERLNIGLKEAKNFVEAL